MSEGDEIQVVTFGLGKENFGVPVAMVREILDFLEPSHLPNGPDYLIGLTDMRGQGIPAICLRLKLGLPRGTLTPSTRILVVDVPLADRTITLGLLVDRVVEVTSLNARDVEAAPDVGIAWRSDYIGGVVRRSDGFLVLVDMTRIFSSAEAALFANPSASEAA